MKATTKKKAKLIASPSAYGGNLFIVKFYKYLDQPEIIYRYDSRKQALAAIERYYENEELDKNLFDYINMSTGGQFDVIAQLNKKLKSIHDLNTK